MQKFKAFAIQDKMT